MADDIVTRDVTDPWQEICDLRDEIERLRAAGDALLRSLNEVSVSGPQAEMDAFLAAVRLWEEARRG